MSDCMTFGISRLLGIISISSWICAQLPQIYTNYVTKSTDGISPSFLLLWFCGDFLSFTSCLFNEGTLKFQLYLSLFFLSNDITLCYQYYYYNSVYPGKHLKSEPKAPGNKVLFDISSVSMGGASVLKRSSVKSQSIEISETSSLSENEESNGYGLALSLPGSTKSLSATLVLAGALLNAAVSTARPLDLLIFSSGSTPEVSLAQDFGTVLAWACTFVYVSSRIPQLMKNHKRKSVEGMSPLLFSSALLGNLAYTLSILTSCDFLGAADRKAYFMLQLPYLLGSSGTIVFDLVYFYQRHIYRPQDYLRLEMDFEDWES
ncbi:hypothetical protein PUMCH_004851 [Australozyma saopauloensis]|uniref:Uncharacterized protein n=1 Tax=Australozyma saopauloensis TaxID=291208 RepID=A0AAX4HGE6_9ASCO|nr:hypothetical protein PUMCH_004851 [[Candida] saopauloensis]